MARRRNPGTRLVRSVLAIFTLVTVALGAGAGAPAGAGAQRASASEAAPVEGVEAQIEAVLAGSPGGQRIGVNQISWSGATVVLTVPGPGERTARGPDEPVTAQGSPNCPHLCFPDD
ncbi:hypothetical protein [Streptomyces adelaidensis]|uniref:hypothetical protein n=1 Tax=Streptomyces adelaidensis TaxID=2796465 RepID=UPI0019039543|nr:hypothetical protein [Streptomyces adelaidensis]